LQYWPNNNTHTHTQADIDRQHRHLNEMALLLLQRGSTNGSTWAASSISRPTVTSCQSVTNWQSRELENRFPHVRTTATIQKTCWNNLYAPCVPKKKTFPCQEIKENKTKQNIKIQKNKYKKKHQVEEKETEPKVKISTVLKSNGRAEQQKQ